MSDNDNNDGDFVPENSDTTNAPDQLSDDADWQCKACGTPLEDAHALANHECAEQEQDHED